MTNATRAWNETISKILFFGISASPRGKKTKELLNHTITVDMRLPVVCVPERKLNYRFMAAEAYWILSGSNRVEDISPYNKHISQFSDNGETFFGAYGPRIQAQLPYVIEKLLEDHDTRQAGLTIWLESPPSTKDVPCTVAIFFNIRLGHLHCHVFMRSSDAWLGLPYDIFNFSMLGHYLCGKLTQREYHLYPGNLHLTAVSSHLYEPHFKLAENCMTHFTPSIPPTPPTLFMDPFVLTSTLRDLRETKPGDSLRWWEVAP